jgi:hypothetical protein
VSQGVGGKAESKLRRVAKPVELGGIAGCVSVREKYRALPAEE